MATTGRTTPKKPDGGLRSSGETNIADDDQAGWRTWRIRLGTLAWAALVLIFLLGIGVLLDVSTLAFVAVAVVALVVAALIFVVLRLIRRRERRPGFGSFVRITLACLCLGVGLAALPIYWLAVKVAVDPLTLPKATLSDGSKTVVFQGMVHVGSEGFYKSVIYDLEEALTEDYHLFYEGVQPGTAEGDKWFADTLAGGGDLSANYQSLAGTCGMQFQLDYFQLLLADQADHPERHVPADVTTTDMMMEWERLEAEDPSLADEEPAEGDDTFIAGKSMDDVVSWLETLDSRQRELVGVVCRGIFTVALGADAEGGENDGLKQVVLDFRNRRLAERIAGYPHDRIYVTYGAAHLPGVIEELKKIDPAWELKSVSWSRAIAAPEELEGSL